MPPIDRRGRAAERDHARRAAARRAGYRTMGLGKWHLGETPAMRPEAQGFDEYLGFYAGASMYVERGDPRCVESRAGRSIRSTFPVGEPALRRAQERRRALRAERVHDRLPGRRSGRRRSRPTAIARSSCTSRSTRRTRRCRRCAADYDALPQIDEPPPARLRRDDPRARSRRRPSARRAAGERPRGQHAGDLHQRQRRRATTSACPTSTSRTAAGR